MPSGISVPKTGRLGTLFKVPIDYILETSGGDMVTLPNQPSMYAQSRPSASVLTYTLNSYIKENSPHRSTHIELRGSSGYVERIGYNRKGDVIFQNGLIILEEFDNWLNDFQKTASNTDYLIFRSLNEGFAYKVSVESFDWTRDAEAHKFSYMWTLKLHAYDEAKESGLTPIFSPITEISRQIADRIDQVNALIALSAVAIENTNKEASQIIRGPVQAVNRMALAFREVSTQIDNIVYGLPASIMSDMRNVLGNTIAAIKQVKQTADFISNANGVLDPYQDQIAILDSQVQELDKNVIELAGVSGALLTTSTNDQVNIMQVIAKNNQIATKYTIRAGETIRTIAQRQLKDEALANNIIQYNRMLDAYTKANGRPLLPGDEILIPVLDAGNEKVYSSREDDYYFTDLKLSSDNDLILENNDLTLVNKEDNLSQAIRNRVLTEKGSARNMLSYGLPVLIGGSVNNRTSAFLAMHTKEQLLRDPRIASVQSVQILVNGDQIAIDCIVQTTQGTTFPLITPIRYEVA